MNREHAKVVTELERRLESMSSADSPGFRYAIYCIKQELDFMDLKEKIKFPYPKILLWIHILSVVAYLTYPISFSDYSFSYYDLIMFGLNLLGISYGYNHIKE